MIGPGPRQVQTLRRIGDDRGFSVRPVLPKGRVRRAESYDVDALLADARSVLDEGSPDGITTFWDFPSSCLSPILAAERGLPAPTLRATVTFEHKYWSRRLHQRVAPEDTPPFAAVDVRDEGVEPPLPFPFWLKPVKSYSGHLGYRVGARDDWDRALAGLRRGIDRLGRPFHDVMSRTQDVPEDVAALGGSAAIAEGILEGRQCTLEGHVHAGEFGAHGVFDIHRAEDGSTFTDYRYPSVLDDDTRQQMARITRDLADGAGFDDGAINVEFFVDEDAGRTWILEINPRISQEHDPLTAWVDGVSNMRVMAEVALGRPPTPLVGEGRAAVAAKYFVRSWQDGVVRDVPGAERVEQLEARFDPCEIDVLVEPGDRLSELPEQEPYSFLLAYVHLGADGPDELESKHRAVVEDLRVVVDEDA